MVESIERNGKLKRYTATLAARLHSFHPTSNLTILVGSVAATEEAEEAPSSATISGIVSGTLSRSTYSPSADERFHLARIPLHISSYHPQGQRRNKSEQTGGRRGARLVRRRVERLPRCEAKREREREGEREKGEKEGWPPGQIPANHSTK